MSTFNDVSGMLQSDITELIIRAEDPEKMVRQITADIRIELDNTMRHGENVRLSCITAKESYQNAVRVSQEWENKARDALVKDDRKLAEQFLFKKVKADEDAESYRKMYESFSDQTELIRLRAETLDAKLKMLNEQRKSLIRLAKLNSVSKQNDALHETDIYDENISSSEKSEITEKVLSELERLVLEMNNPDNSGK